MAVTRTGRDQVGEINWDSIRAAFERHRDAELGVAVGEACADYGIFALPEPDKHRRNRLWQVGELLLIADKLLAELLDEVPTTEEGSATQGAEGSRRDDE